MSVLMMDPGILTYGALKNLVVERIFQTVLHSGFEKVKSNSQRIFATFDYYY